jgi:hypothetical protein
MIPWAMRLEKIQYEIPIVKSVDSNQKEKLLNFKPIELEREEVKVKIEEQSKKDNSIDAVVTASLASIAVFIRYFVVVDIFINLFGKINVDLGPRIQNLVDLLKQLEFPALGFTAKTSPINDGGKEAIKTHEEYLEQKKKVQVELHNQVRQEKD